MDRATLSDSPEERDSYYSALWPITRINTRLMWIAVAGSSSLWYVNLKKNQGFKNTFSNRWKHVRQCFLIHHKGHEEHKGLTLEGKNFV